MQHRHKCRRQSGLGWQAYVCLFDGKPELPQIPASVTFMETLVQLPMSAALIFLVLLAVKNRYKIK